MLNEKSEKKSYSFDAARFRMETYCVYQERSQQEVRNKLYEMRMYPAQIDEIIAYLIENNFLNELRFANAFVSGKFRIKKWGRKKIKQGLKLKGVSEPVIKKALSQLIEDEYIEVLTEIMKKKYIELGAKDDAKTKSKLVNYALSKGYENDLIFLILNHKELDAI